MFDFLKDLFGVPRPIKVIGYEPPEVVFTSETPLDIGVVGVLADIEGVKIKGQVQIVESGLTACRGLWIAPQEVVPLLNEVFSHNEKRNELRYRRRLRVRSPKLESFQGNSLDLSESGMRLEGKGELQLGEVVPLSFELDDARQTEMVTTAKVCWIGPAETDGWLAIGLHYNDVNDIAQRESFSYYRDFLARIGREQQEV